MNQSQFIGQFRQLPEDHFQFSKRDGLESCLSLIKKSLFPILEEIPEEFNFQIDESKKPKILIKKIEPQLPETLAKQLVAVLHYFATISIPLTSRPPFIGPLLPLTQEQKNSLIQPTLTYSQLSENQQSLIQHYYSKVPAEFLALDETTPILLYKILHAYGAVSSIEDFNSARGQLDLDLIPVNLTEEYDEEYVFSGIDTYDMHWGESQGSPQEFVIKSLESAFKTKIAGRTLSAKFSKVFSENYWIKLFKKLQRRNKELSFYASHQISSSTTPIVSAYNQAIRTKQLFDIEQWFKTTQAQRVVGGKPVGEAISLAQLVKTVEQKFAKVYTFIQALDQIAIEEKLEVSLITLTLEPAYHANPEYRRKGHKWNGVSPADSARLLSKRFRSITQYLSPYGIQLRGMWCSEPHKDGTPHRHIWCMYAPEQRAKVLQAIIKYFPEKLKLRTSNKKADDLIYPNIKSVRNNTPRKPKHNESSQVDVSVIDRELSSGASYVVKYVLKSLAIEEVDNAVANMNKAIDAHRSLWNLKSYQFFGIKASLTLWEEFRRLHKTPKDSYQAKLWESARGTADEKVLKVLNPETGLEEWPRGDAYTFIKLMQVPVQLIDEDLTDTDVTPSKLYLEPTGRDTERVRGISSKAKLVFRLQENDTYLNIATGQVLNADAGEVEAITDYDDEGNLIRKRRGSQRKVIYKSFEKSVIITRRFNFNLAPVPEVDLDFIGPPTALFINFKYRDYRNKNDDENKSI